MSLCLGMGWGPVLKQVLGQALDVPQGIDYLYILSTAALICAAIPAAMFAVNVWFFRRPGRDWNRRHLPPVSILIPARNEELSIAACIEAVVASRGVRMELIVLDDGSTDGTAELVQAAIDEGYPVRLETAPPLPEGWNGKQHACWVLASLAEYDVFCFLDADVRVGPEALYRMMSEINYIEPVRVEKAPVPAVDALAESGRLLSAGTAVAVVEAGVAEAGLAKAEEAQPAPVEKAVVEKALVSGFPHQQTSGLLEWLMLPLIHFVLLGFLPFPAERWSRRSAFAAGCGQVMLTRREAYFSTGGHSSIRTSMHDGLLLPKLFRRDGFQTSVYDLTRDAECRMYTSSVQLWNGLAKNATEGMASPGRIPIFTVLLLLGQVLPWPLAKWAWDVRDAPSFRFLLLTFLLGYIVRFVSAGKYRQSWWGAVFHPIGVLLIVLLQWYALLRKLVGRPAMWKQRKYRVG